MGSCYCSVCFSVVLSWMFFVDAVNVSTNSRVVWWSFFEAVVLVVMSVGQVYYLNRFFEVRTTV
eukprot:m.1016190 g.1016190  ORF g.1016190 m.1016190 type:complete len:64 (-) comp24078_c0_seq9:3015-3206(-)